MNLPKRKPHRLKGFDYSQNGAYFVTVCVKGRKNLFWDSSQTPAVVLSEYGLAAEDVVRDIALHYPTVTVDKYAIMPNHVHLLLIFQTGSPPLSTVMNQFKGHVTKRIGFSCWQKLFYDHVVRDDNDYLEIWQYIDSNPHMWDKDCFYEP